MTQALGTTRSYPRRVANVLGVVGIFVFIAVIISLAAGVTWVVVRFSPNPNKKRESASSTST